MEKKRILLGVAVIIALGAGFFGGMMYEKGSVAASSLGQDVSMRAGIGSRASGFGGMAPRTGSAGIGGGFATGEILSRDEKSITIRTPDGGSKIVYFSDTTSISKSYPTAASDLLVGERVRVNGKNGPDGTVAAGNIDILPQGAASDRVAN